MCFKRKKKEELITKYKIGQRVSFRQDDKRGLIFGYIYDARKGIDDKIYYDIQVGGECPYIKRDVLEEAIILNK